MKAKSHIVQRDYAAGSHQFQAHLVVSVVLQFVGVDKHKVKCARLAPIHQLLYNVITPATYTPLIPGTGPLF